MDAMETMDTKKKSNTIRAFLKKKKWVTGDCTVSFLAAGEYNENYLVTAAGNHAYVFRINHGSQLGLDDQVSYEFNVLDAVYPSGVTPRPLYHDPSPEEFDGGVLLMVYLPGRPLRYPDDTRHAAEVFAAIHSLKPDNRLIVQSNPVLDIAAESHELLTRFPHHPLTEEQGKLFELHNIIQKMGQSMREEFQSEQMCMVNTEVNSHNFIIDDEDDRAYLVDWEKAVISHRYQDLGHFLTPTTTLWKGNYIYSADEKTEFLREYESTLKTGIPLDELREKTRLLERTIILRGLSWCYMAWYEYTRSDRKLQNHHTFNTIQNYLADIDWFLREDVV